MTEFVAGEYDILVCTTIIESGLDIPNCNTIIIEGADKFGLSQLYQLRGRVGRFKRQAYAYLLVNQSLGITDTARKRLSSIKQINNFGAGFRIALRDLELRGAGNLLGSEQSGHVAELVLRCTASYSRKASPGSKVMKSVFARQPLFDWIS